MAVDESRKETAGRIASMYQTDYVRRTCLCYSYCCGCLACFCCASVFLSFPFALGRILLMLLRFCFLSVTSTERAQHLFSSLFMSIPCPRTNKPTKNVETPSGYDLVEPYLLVYLFIYFLCFFCLLRSSLLSLHCLLCLLHYNVVSLCGVVTTELVVSLL